MAKRQLPELLRLVHDQLVDADLTDGQQVVLARAERLQLGFQALLHALDALAGQAVVAVHLLQQRGVARQRVLDQPPLELGRRWDELERRVGDNDAVPRRRRRTGQEALPLVLAEVGFVRHQDAGVRIQQQELPARLRQAVARHHHHCLADQPQALLLHDRGGHAEGLAGPDGVGDVGAAGADDAPDHPLLVLAQADDAAGPRELQVPPVERARPQVVEAVVVAAGQPLGALHVGPDPALERLLDLPELLLCRFGLRCVQLAVVAVGVAPGVVDLRDAGVQRVVQQFARVPPGGAPLGCGGGLAREGVHVDGPRCHLHGVAHPRRDADHLGREALHHAGRYPGCPKARGDLGRLQVLGLHALQGVDVPGVARIEHRGGHRRRKLGADRPGQVGVGRLPRLMRRGGALRVEEHRIAQLGQHLLARPAQHLGDPGDIDVADLVQRHRQRIGGRGDDGFGWRMDHPLGEDRPHLRGAALLVILLDRGHQPHVGVVEERRQVRPAHRLARLARLRVRARADTGQVDRPELPHEGLVGRAQPALQHAPGLVCFLRPQHRPHGVPHRQQRLDDAGVLGEDTLLHRRRLHGHALRHAVDHLRQHAVQHCPAPIEWSMQNVSAAWQHTAGVIRSDLASRVGVWASLTRRPLVQAAGSPMMSAGVPCCNAPAIARSARALRAAC